MSSSNYLPWYRQEVGNIIRDETDEIQSADLNRLISRAIDIYSSAFPREIIIDKTGDGSTYEWDVPDDWEYGFSQITRLEYPAGRSDERTLEDIDEDDYLVIRTATDTYKWRLLYLTPSSGETVRFTYIVRHSVTETSTTIPNEADEDKIVSLAASFAFRAIAAYYAHTIEATQSADTVEHKDRTEKFSALADKYEEMSGLSFILKEGIGGPAFTFKHVKSELTTGDTPLTHEWIFD